jgi:hypothetical protein
MRSVLVQLDDETYRALNKLVPPTQRRRMGFIRKAIKDAIRREECQKIRHAYKVHPDSSADADDWSTAEEFAI